MTRKQRYILQVEPDATEWCVTLRSGDADHYELELTDQQLGLSILALGHGNISVIDDQGWVQDFCVSAAADGLHYTVMGSAEPLRVVLFDEKRLARRDRDAGTAPATTTQQLIVAPMPGRIVKVLVQMGESVEEGQAVVVVSAMKMDNELRAVRRGRVQQVNVQSGDSVEAGQTLVVFE